MWLLLAPLLFLRYVDKQHSFLLLFRLFTNYQYPSPQIQPPFFFSPPSPSPSLPLSQALTVLATPASSPNTPSYTTSSPQRSGSVVRKKKARRVTLEGGVGEVKEKKVEKVKDRFVVFFCFFFEGWKIGSDCFFYHTPSKH